MQWLKDLKYSQSKIIFKTNVKLISKNLQEPQEIQILSMTPILSEVSSVHQLADGELKNIIRGGLFLKMLYFIHLSYYWLFLSHWAFILSSFLVCYFPHAGSTMDRLNLIPEPENARALKYFSKNDQLSGCFCSFGQTVTVGNWTFWMGWEIESNVVIVWSFFQSSNEW